MHTCGTNLQAMHEYSICCAYIYNHGYAKVNLATLKREVLLYLQSGAPTRFFGSVDRINCEREVFAILSDQQGRCIVHDRI